MATQQPAIHEPQRRLSFDCSLSVLGGAAMDTFFGSMRNGPFAANWQTGDLIANCTSDMQAIGLHGLENSAPHSSPISTFAVSTSGPLWDLNPSGISCEDVYSISNQFNSNTSADGGSNYSLYAEQISFPDTENDLMHFWSPFTPRRSAGQENVQSSQTSTPIGSLPSQCPSEGANEPLPDNEPPASNPASPPATQSKGKRPANKSYKSRQKTAQKCQEKRQSYQTKQIKPKWLPSHPEVLVEVWTPQGKPVKTKSPQVRRKIADTRRWGACIYHQKRKRECDPSWRPYVECLKVLPPNMLFLEKPENIQLFRQGPTIGHPLASQRPELFFLQEITNSQALKYGLQHLQLSQGLRRVLDVWVSPFAHSSGDKTDHVWFRQGQRITIGLPHYCIVDLQWARSNFDQYIHEALPDYMQHVIRYSGDIVQEVLSYAIAYQNTHQAKSTLVSSSLRLLAANRMIEDDWQIVGQNTLGIQRIMDGDCPWFRKVPITPMMDTQLDQIVIKDYLTPLAKELLHELQQKLYQYSRDNLLEIFLAIFVLATNLEWLLRHSRRNAVRYNARRRYNSIELAQSYIKGHNVLLSHFHRLTEGSEVSANGSTSSDMLGSGLTQDQLEFMAGIRQKIEAQSEYLQGLRETKKYEAELYWSHQMFLGDWAPHSTVIDDEVAGC